MEKQDLVKNGEAIENEVVGRERSQEILGEIKGEKYPYIRPEFQDEIREDLKSLNPDLLKFFLRRWDDLTIEENVTNHYKLDDFSELYNGDFKKALSDMEKWADVPLRHSSSYFQHPHEYEALWLKERFSGDLDKIRTYLEEKGPFSGWTDDDHFCHDIIGLARQIGKDSPEFKEQSSEIVAKMIMNIVKDMYHSGGVGVITHDEEVEDLIPHRDAFSDNVMSYKVAWGIIALGDIGSDKSIDFLADFVQKPYFSLTYLNNIADAVSKINPQTAVEKFLPLLRSEDLPTRKIAGKILQRIELGAIGISKEGIEYLGKRYDLGKFNDSNFFVKRVSATGELGIGEKKELLAVFKIDLSPRELVKAEIMSVTTEMLLGPGEKESEAEKQQREQIRNEFLKNYFGFIEAEVFQKTKINLNNFALHEQSGFFEYWKEAGTKEKERMQQFLDNFGETGLRTFLTIDLYSRLWENQGIDGKTVLELGEKWDRESTERVFTDFNNLLNLGWEMFQNLKEKGELKTKEFVDEEKTKVPEEYQILLGAESIYKVCEGQAGDYLHFIAEMVKNNPQMSYREIVEGHYSPEAKFKITNLREGALAKIVVLMSNKFGAEETRKALNNVDFKSALIDVRDSFAKIQELLSPEPEKQMFDSKMADFYERMNFENYQINQELQSYDESIVADIARNNKVSKKGVLDLGAGTGRMLKTLGLFSDNLYALDITPRHIEKIHHDFPEVKTIQKDWTTTGLKDNEVGMVVSIGRSISHEVTFERQLALFREAQRVLDDNGIFVFDVPDGSDGGVYSQRIKEYAETMRARGITNFRPNSTFESPDGKSFVTRHLYTADDILQLAELTGFELIETKKMGFEVPTEKGSKQVSKGGSVYYVLRKKPGVKLENTELERISELAAV